MTDSTQRPTRRPWLKWLGITIAVLAGLYGLAVLVVVAMFYGTGF